MFVYTLVDRVCGCFDPYSFLFFLEFISFFYWYVEDITIFVIEFCLKGVEMFNFLIEYCVYVGFVGFSVYRGIALFP